MATKQCLSYIDFLGASACNFTSRFGKNYTNYICVYALSAKRSSEYQHDLDETVIHDLTAQPLTSFNWNNITNRIKFAVADSDNYMCYKFKLSNVNTESDDEPDAPYSYEELFNECVLDNMYSSTAMQYKHIYSAYSEMTPTPIAGMGKTTQELALNNFKTTNNLASDKDFVRSDYYKFFVPETDVIHNRSMLELSDGELASVSNRSHDVFNCLLYCINPCYDNKIRYDVSHNRINPSGFNSRDAFQAVPISICTYSQDVSLAGNNIQFEPNLNGIVTVE